MVTLYEIFIHSHTAGAQSTNKWTAEAKTVRMAEKAAGGGSRWTAVTGGAAVIEPAVPTRIAAGKTENCMCKVNHETF